MLEAKFNDSEVFSKILKLPSDLVKQIKIIALNEKFITKKKEDTSPTIIFYIVALNDNRTNFLSIELAKEDFEIWKCDAPKSTEIKRKIENEDGSTTEYTISPHHELIITMERFVKMLDRKKAGEEITMRYDPEKDKNLILDMKAKTAKKGHQLKIAIEKDFDHDEISPDAIRSVKLINTCKINYKTIDSAVKDAEIFNTIMSISTKSDDLIFKSQSYLGESESNVEDEDITDKTFKKDTDIPFEIEFIKTILKGGNIDPMLKISFGSAETDSTPILAEYIFKNSRITYLAAPRVEDEEEYDEDYYTEENVDEPKESEIKEEEKPKEKKTVKKTTKEENKSSKAPAKATKKGKEEVDDEEISDDDIDIDDLDDESLSDDIDEIDDEDI